MIRMTKYTSRPIRFLEVYDHHPWKIKVYSISARQEIVSQEHLALAKANLDLWLEKAKESNLPTYNIATLLVHEGREGVFAILNWWIDENMLQTYAYLKTPGQQAFHRFSDGIVLCVWEMEVIWHERNAWIKHVLQKGEQPDFEAYLNDQLISEQ